MPNIKTAIINATEKSQRFKTLIFKDEMTSTQYVAKEYMNEINESFLVSTLAQTDSIGRFKRVWESPKNSGFYGSFVFRPNISMNKATEFNLFISLAIAKSCETFINKPVGIKWPNDIYINDKKVCGFLTDIINENNMCDTIICGIGINIFSKKSNVNKKAALEDFTSENLDYSKFIHILIQNIEYYYQLFLSESFNIIRDEWINYSTVLGERIQISSYNEKYYAKVIDIDNSGFLKVIDDFGKIRNVISADIEIYGGN